MIDLIKEDECSNSNFRGIRREKKRCFYCRHDYGNWFIREFHTTRGTIKTKRFICGICIDLGK